jgi:hypothetical protein
MGGKEMLCDELKRKYSDITGPYYGYNEVNAAIAELNAKLESVQASAYADSVDAGMRERRLRRALWIARANRAIEKIAWFKLWNASISTMNPEDGARQEFDKWKNNLGKFLKKAENY